MTVQRLQAHYGFTRMPFGRNLAPGMLHRYTGHGEAVARISWCVEQHALGVITGEVGAGKTVAVRAATAALDTSRHVVIYLPNPSVGVRGMLHHIVSALGQVPSFYTATLTAQAVDALYPRPDALRPDGELPGQLSIDDILGDDDILGGTVDPAGRDEATG